MYVLEEFSKVIATKISVNPIFLTGLTMFSVFAITLRKSVNFSLKAKELIFNSAGVRYFIALFFLVFLFAQASYGQVERRPGTPSGVLPVKSDSLNRALPDTIPPAPVDTLKADSIKVPLPKGDIETTINYTARDSILMSWDNKMIWLFGQAKITYGDIELEAEEIIIDYGNSTLTAHGIRDSLGQRVGYPIFKDGQQIYETKDIVYNFKTKRARISEVVTAQGEGFIHSEAAFK